MDWNGWHAPAQLIHESSPELFALDSVRHSLLELPVVKGKRESAREWMRGHKIPVFRMDTMQCHGAKKHDGWRAVPFVAAESPGMIDMPLHEFRDSQGRRRTSVLYAEPELMRLLQLVTRRSADLEGSMLSDGECAVNTLQNVMSDFLANRLVPRTFLSRSAEMLLAVNDGVIGSLLEELCRGRWRAVKDECRHQRTHALHLLKNTSVSPEWVVKRINEWFDCLSCAKRMSRLGTEDVGQLLAEETMMRLLFCQQ